MTTNHATPTIITYGSQYGSAEHYARKFADCTSLPIFSYRDVESAELMAAQLCLPISVWINLCDREPERENEVMKLIERHIRQFFERY